jgi:hypothetical protein
MRYLVKGRVAGEYRTLHLVTAPKFYVIKPFEANGDSRYADPAAPHSPQAKQVDRKHNFTELHL